MLKSSPTLQADIFLAMKQLQDLEFAPEPYEDLKRAYSQLKQLVMDLQLRSNGVFSEHGELIPVFQPLQQRYRSFGSWMTGVSHGESYPRSQLLAGVEEIHALMHEFQGIADQHPELFAGEATDRLSAKAAFKTAIEDMRAVREELAARYGLPGWQLPSHLKHLCAEMERLQALHDFGLRSSGRQAEEWERHTRQVQALTEKLRREG